MRLPWHIQNFSEIETLLDTHLDKLHAMIGRRRIGRTYLIREFFTSQKCKLFHATGLQHGSQKKQLKEEGA